MPSNVGVISRRKLSPSLKSIIMLVISILLLAAVCASLLTYICFRIQREKKYSFAIVFDAGSSHTQMMIFKWLGDKSNGKAGTSLVDEIFSLNREPDITSIIKNGTIRRESVGKYFQNFMKHANNILPFSIRKETPILLGATAGMRLLRIENLPLARKLLNEINKFFKSHGYRVTDKGIRIISGKEEAISAWISVNAMKSRIHPRTRKLIPFGALDLGGASTQIAFNTNDKLAKTHKITLFGSTFNLAAFSFLCFGKSQIRKNYDYKLILNNPMRTIIKDPCSVRGDRRNVSLADLYKKPCYLGGNYLKWNELKTVGQKNKNYTIMGYGDSGACQISIKSILHRNCKQNTCQLNGTTLAPIPKETEFLGFAAFYYIWNQLGKPQTTKEYVDSLDWACSASKQELQIKTNNTKELSYFLQLCFDGWYAMNLLSAYGLDEDTQNNRLYRMRKISNKSVGWAYGFMINQTNLMPEIYPSLKPFYVITNAVSLCLLWLVTFLCLFLFTLLCCRIKGCDN